MYLVFKNSGSLSKPENGLGDRRVCGTQESQNGGEGSWRREGQALGPEVVRAYQARPGAARAAAGARGPAALDSTHLPIHRARVRPPARDPNPRPEGPWRASTRCAEPGRPRCPRPPSIGSRRQAERSPWLSTRPHYLREWKKQTNERRKRRWPWRWGLP